MNQQCNPDAIKPKPEPSALSEGLHTLLDVVGMIPVVGELADGANAAIYAAEGDYTNAAMSAAAMIPLAGNVVGATKIGRRAIEVIGKAKALGKAKVARKLTAAQRKVASKLDNVARHRVREGLPEYATKTGNDWYRCSYKSQQKRLLRL